MRQMYDYKVGNTPLVELPAVNGNRIFIKLEGENFLGSVKARTAYWIIHELPESARGKIIIESSSGNLGLALGFFCRENGLDFLCLVDKSIAKKKLERLQSEVIPYRLVEQESGYDLRNSRIREAAKLMNSGKYHWVNQYDNPSGVKAHEFSTGPELWEQTSGTITHCVCPIGSGGTICGLGRFFKKHAPSVHICGVEPYGSTIYGTMDAPYLNAGAGLTGKPGNIIRNSFVIDSHYVVRDEDSIRYAEELFRRHGCSVGLTGGMAYAVALRLAAKETRAVIVVIAPDAADSYREYFPWLEEKGV